MDGRGWSGSSAQRGGSRPSTRRPSSLATERLDLVEPQRGEPVAGDRRQIGARALHPQDALLTAGVIDDDALRRRVAAALVRDGAVRAEEVRAVYEGAQAVEPGRGRCVPEIRRGRDPAEGAGEAAQATASSVGVTRRRSRGRTGAAPRRAGVDGHHVDPCPTPRIDLGRRRARVGDDPGELLDGHKGEEGTAMPLRPVEDPVHLVARIGHLLLDPDLVRVQIHQAAREAEPARAEKSLVDTRRAEHVGTEVAHERHRRQAQDTTGERGQ